MSLDPSEFGTADLEIAAVVRSQKASDIDSKKKRKETIRSENYKMPDYGTNNYGLGNPTKKHKSKDPFDILF